MRIIMGSKPPLPYQPVKINTKCCGRITIEEVTGDRIFYMVYYRDRNGDRKFCEMKEFLGFHPGAKRAIDMMISWIGD